MAKPKVIQINDRNLCELVKREAKKRGMYYFPFATECLRAGFHAIKESSQSVLSAGERQPPTGVIRSIPPSQNTPDHP